MTQGIRGSSPLWAAQAEPRAEGNCGVSTRGKEAGGKTTDTMNKNRIQGRDWLGKGAMDSGARNLCGSQHGKFGVACREALSLIPGGPNGLPAMATGAAKRSEGPAGVSRGRSSGSEPFDREGPNRKTIRKSEL